MTKRTITLITVGFFALMLIVYGQSLNNKFVRWDDGLLIYENPVVRDVSTRSIAEAFSSYDPELYIPLTLLSYQFDYLVSGTNPFGYHFMNLLLHTLNALLVALFIFLISKRKWVALFCGILFAVHPLHTEAVAWASARKDVLATFFFLLTLIIYEKRKTTSLPTGHLPLATYLCALLSKVSVVTLPLVLILIDYYQGRKFTKQTLIEKIPYFALSIIFGIVAIAGKAGTSESMTLIQKFLMSCRSTVFYITKLFAPTNLSVLYPAIGDISILRLEYAIPALIIAIITTALIVFRKNRTLVFSVIFFLVTLAPSFTTFAKGSDFYFASDRYAYIPSIGILFLICMLLFQLYEKKRPLFIIHYSLLICAIVFALMSHAQSKIWSDSESLFLNVIENYDSYRAYNNIGNVYRMEGDLDNAIAEFETALDIKPNVRTLSNLGAVYRKQGMIKEALDEYRKAIELDPEDPEPYFGLGLIYAQSGDADQAKQSYLKALDLDPYYAEVYSNIGALYVAAGRYEEAIQQYLHAIEADSLFVQSYYNLGIAYSKLGKTAEAAQAYEGAVELFPDFIAARLNLGILYYNQGLIEDAVRQFEQVLKVDPENGAARSALIQMSG